jgi:hypothetical protein
MRHKSHDVKSEEVVGVDNSQTCMMPQCKSTTWVSSGFCLPHLIEAINTALPKADRIEFLNNFAAILNKTTYRQREIFKLAYGFGDGYTYTHEEIGRIFKVLPERIKQLLDGMNSRLEQTDTSQAIYELCKQYFHTFNDKPHVSGIPNLLLQGNRSRR